MRVLTEEMRRRRVLVLNLAVIVTHKITRRVMHVLLAGSRVNLNSGHGGWVRQLRDVPDRMRCSAARSC